MLIIAAGAYGFSSLAGSLWSLITVTPVFFSGCTIVMVRFGGRFSFAFRIVDLGGCVDVSGGEGEAGPGVEMGGVRDISTLVVWYCSSGVCQEDTR